MSRAKNFFAPEEYYHVYNRGTEKRKIFLTNKDYLRFISLLYLCNTPEPIHRSDYLHASLAELLAIKRGQTLVDIGAYCLMPNHFHILLHEHTDNGISIFMQKLTTAYTMYFNKKYDRNGVLFQGKFKAEHITQDNHLKYLFAYINLNPLGIVNDKWKEHVLENKKEAGEHLKSYRYSSYLDYYNKETRNIEGKILNKTVFPEYFRKPKDYRDYIKDILVWSKNSDSAVDVKVRP